MATAIYLGEIEIVTILEERGMAKGTKPGHIEAAVLSYRKEICKDMIEINENNYNLNICLLAASKSNNLGGAELLISKGADINAILIIKI